MASFRLDGDFESEVPIDLPALAQGETCTIPWTVANLPVGVSATQLVWRVKTRERDADGAALFTKAITTTFVAGVGQITNNGAATRTAAGNLLITAAESAALSLGRKIHNAFVHCSDNQVREVVVGVLPIIAGSGGSSAFSSAMSVLIESELAVDEPAVAVLVEVIQTALAISPAEARAKVSKPRTLAAPLPTAWDTQDQYLDIDKTGLTDPQIAAIGAGLDLLNYPYTGGVPFDEVVVDVVISPIAPSKVHPGTQQFAATAYNLAGQPIPGAAMVFTSATTATATIDASTGLATTVAVGTSVIRATSGTIFDETTLTVAAAGGFFDDFNRADDAASLGASYTAHRGTFAIASNQMRVITDIGGSDYNYVSRAMGGTGAVTNKYKVKNLPGSSSPGVTIRESGDGNHHVKFEHQGNGANQCVLVTRNGAVGTETVIGTPGTGTLAVDDILEIREDAGGNIRGYINGVVVVGPATTALHVGNTRVGLTVYNTVAWRGDDWTCTLP